MLRDGFADSSGSTQEWVMSEELFNMLINPETQQFALRWHRDDVKESATEEEERDALSIWHHGVSIQRGYGDTLDRPVFLLT